MQTTRCNGRQELLEVLSRFHTAGRRQTVVGRRAERFSADDDVEWTSWNVLVAPLDHEHVVASLTRTVVDRVLALSDMAHGNLVARNLRSHHSHHQHVVTYK